MTIKKVRPAIERKIANKVIAAPPAREKAEAAVSPECQDTIKALATAVPRSIPNLAERLATEVKQGEYSELAAYALSVASAWAYGDAWELGKAMWTIGWDNHEGKHAGGTPYSLSIRNDALLVNTDVSVLQDASGKVVILCFRGTEPTNVITWLSDMTFEMERFYSWGEVHSGFYHGVLPVWPFIASALEAALEAKPVSQGRKAGIIPGRPLISSGKTALDRLKSPMEALYICGHSLGAAQALLATALLFEDPKYACLQEKLRGVYTFGTPKIGDKQFADACQARFGDRVFRHVYGNDVVTAMPPRLYGEFNTFGEEYVSTSDGWTHNKSRLYQPDLLISSALVSVIGWVLLQIPLVRSIPLPLSLAAHRPWGYVKCSRLSLPFYG
jgi:Lipase (class 3)